MSHTTHHCSQCPERFRCPAPEACQLADAGADASLEMLGGALIVLAIASAVALFFIFK